MFTTIKNLASAATQLASSLPATISKYQPVSTTGALLHSIKWVFAGGHAVYKNPNFVPKHPQDKGISVRIIHGTADRAGSAHTIATRLATDLPQDISEIQLDEFEGRATGKSIEDYTDQFFKKIIASGNKNIILIGHSRGGLIAACLKEKYAKELKEAGINILQVFTICTPFQGSGWALQPLTSVSTSVNQMQIGAEFLNTLSQNIIKSGTQYICFAAENDWIVTPGACIPRAGKHISIELDKHGHLSIMSSHRIVDIIQNYFFHIVRSLNQSADEVKLDIKKGYAHPKVNSANKLHDIGYATDCKIAELKKEGENAQLLVEFKSHLEKLISGEINEEVKTIGDFIQSFLQEKNAVIPQPGLFSDPLNYGKSFLFSLTPEPVTFLESLKAEYKGTSLPKKSERSERKVAEYH